MRTRAVPAGLLVSALSLFASGAFADDARPPAGPAKDVPAIDPEHAELIRELELLSEWELLVDMDPEEALPVPVLLDDDPEAEDGP